MKYLLISLCFVVLGVVAWYFYHAALVQSTYVGLPTVACIDPTQPIKQQFSLHIAISLQNKNYLLGPSIGHDYGNCLHTIFTNDSSGTVYVKANDTTPLTLGQFFDVWHQAFSNKQIFQYQTTNNHTLTVWVNGKQVDTYRQTVLYSDENIVILYH